MHLEHITAPPPAATPQQRYATLHRAVDKGIASDATWSELAEVCVRLGRPDEALASMQRVASPRERRNIASVLRRSGVMVAEERSAAARTTIPEPESPLRDSIQDTVRFLADSHMPVTVTTATAVFPVAVGFAGFLTRGGPAYLLPLVALGPALLVMALITALGRRALIDAANGADDAPRLPPLRELPAMALRTWGDGLAILGVLLVPALIAHFIGAGILNVLLAGLAGLFFAPLAIGLRVRDSSWKALHPRTLVTTAWEAGPRYAGMAGAILTLFVPAFAAWTLSSEAIAFLRPALVGPLVALPMLIASRLIGRYLHLTDATGHNRAMDSVVPVAQTANRRPASGPRPAAGRMPADGVLPSRRGPRPVARPDVARPRQIRAGLAPAPKPILDQRAPAPRRAPHGSRIEDLAEFTRRSNPPRSGHRRRRAGC
ncbi:MAG: hypothetical protein AAF628_24275 [Planctomycetota bacterium]